MRVIASSDSFDRTFSLACAPMASREVARFLDVSSVTPFTWSKLRTSAAVANAVSTLGCITRSCPSRDTVPIRRSTRTLLKQHECVFRDRLHEEKEPERWWNYGADEVEAVAAVAD